MSWIHAHIHVATHSYFEVDALCEGSKVSGEAIRLQVLMLLQCQKGIPPIYIATPIPPDI